MNSLLPFFWALLGTLQDPPPIAPQEFAALRAVLFTKTEATWEKIPWTLDLLEARSRAVRDRKPLFIWSMNGHPLGCV